MIDIKLVRENPELVKKSCKDRAAQISDKEIVHLIKLDKEWRDLKRNTKGVFC